MNRRDLMLLAAGTHTDPHTVLGAHPHPDGTVIRTLRPHADSVSARIGGVDHPLRPIGHGVFEGVVEFPDLWDYRLIVSYPGSRTVLTADGYRFLPTVGELDLHLPG